MYVRLLWSLKSALRPFSQVVGEGEKVRVFRLAGPPGRTEAPARPLAALIFDADGTLLDSLPPHVDFCHAMNAELGLAKPAIHSTWKKTSEGGECSAQKALYGVKPWCSKKTQWNNGAKAIAIYSSWSQKSAWRHIWPRLRRTVQRG